jgi:anti-anti-sigma factor
MRDRSGVPEANKRIRPVADQLESADHPGVPQQAPDPVGPLVDARSTDGPSLDVLVRFVPSLPVVRLRGELELSSAHLLQDAIESLVTSSQAGSAVLLDLRGLDFCDVRGLAAINQARVRLAGVGIPQIVRDLPEGLRGLMQRSGLDEEFQIN